MKARFFYVAFPMLVGKTPHKLSFGNIISEMLRCRFRTLRLFMYCSPMLVGGTPRKLSFSNPLRCRFRTLRLFMYCSPMLVGGTPRKLSFSNPSRGYIRFHLKRLVSFLAKYEVL